MNTKHRAYALTEMLVIIVMLIVLISLTVRPLRTLVSEIPRTARTCQSLNATTAALEQLKDDIEKSTQITGLENATFVLEHTAGTVTYTIADGRMTRSPGLNPSDAEYTWNLPYVKIGTHLWNQDDATYAVELTTWNQQTVQGREQRRFKQSVVFFRKGNQR
ncbi:MAG: hypothetical protein ACYS72_01740 [Planctomycetota bacterium]|jgi:type II secretory pathway pseudopilin PulG